MRKLCVCHQRPESSFGGVAQWYQRRYGVTPDAQTEICSCGLPGGLAHIALSIVDEGETVLVPDPCYPVFGDGPLIGGAKLAYMPQKKENGYVIQLQDIPGGDGQSRQADGRVLSQ